MNAKLRILTRTGVLLAVAVLMQWLGKITGDALTLGIGTTVLVGSLVNLILFLSVTYCGIWGSKAIGLLTPVMALVIGQLPSPLLIPFVGAANIILVLTFYFAQRLRRFHKFATLAIGVVVAAVFKFLFMRFAIVPLLPLLGLEKLVNTLTIGYGVVQLFAALIGGGLYFSVSLALEKAKIQTADKLLLNHCPAVGNMKAAEAVEFDDFCPIVEEEGESNSNSQQ